MSLSIERTQEAIVIKLPLDTHPTDLQQMLNYFEYVSLVSKSKAAEADIEKLAKEAKAGWWEKNKERFKGQPGFEDVV